MANYFSNGSLTHLNSEQCFIKRIKKEKNVLAFLQTNVNQAPASG